MQRVEDFGKYGTTLLRFASFFFFRPRVHCRQLLWAELPEPRRTITAGEQPVKIEGIKESNDEWPIVAPPGTLQLSLSISRQEDFVGLWKVSARMPDVKHRSIDEHDTRLEDPKEGLVRVDVAGVSLEELNDPIYTSSRDNRGADVQHIEDGS